MLIKVVGVPGFEKAIPLMCSRCKKPIRQKSRRNRGEGNQAVNPVGICKKCVK